MVPQGARLRARLQARHSTAGASCARRWSGIIIGLGQTEELKHGGTVPTFGVKDIVAARAHLESLGTKFDGDTYEIDGMVKLATFYDPDGNAWMLAE